MKLSEAGVKFIAGKEDCRLEAYLCPAKVWTIGIGTTRWLDGRAVKQGDKLMSKAEAIELFYLTSAKFVACVNRSVKTKVTQNQFDALVSLCYNIGEGAFANSTLVKLLNSGSSLNAVAAQFLRWDKVQGVPCNGLTLRRQAEAQLFLGK